MIEIALNGVKKDFGFKKVLNGLSLEINNGERVALVGRNGAGKTTIFDIISGKESCDDGMKAIRNGAKIGYLEQIPPAENNNLTVREIIYLGQEKLFEIEKEMEEVARKMQNPSSDEELERLMKKYGKLEEEFSTKGGYELEEKFSKICSGCKISDELLERKYNILSGGEKTRINLAKILYSNPDILLLDEPTNHLDIQSIEWLEEFLNNYKGTVMISSHDRYFLDKVAKRIILIERGEAEVFNGNYSYYLEENERRIMAEFDNYEDQQKKIKAMKAAIKKLQEFGRLASPGGEAFFKRAASIQKRLDKMELLEKPEEKKKINLSFDVKSRSGKEVVKVQDLGVILGDNIVLEQVDMNISYGEKVCIVGNNGSGKSTLIKSIMNEIIPTSGEIKVGDSVKIGYIPQEIKFKNENSTILEEFTKFFIGDETRARAILSKFMFNAENVFKNVGSLSGGEKVRLQLACLMQQDTNCIIMDEPTNHIDIDTREVLEEALQDYRGTLIAVTHDRYFANKLATRIIEINDGKAKSYTGNYDYYRNKKDIVPSNTYIESKEEKVVSLEKEKKTNKKKKNRNIKDIER